MADLLLPLFPLKVVLFPRTRLGLHIFEERYKEMIADCLANRWEFGVVLVQEESLESAGCTASISEVVRKYDDGRMDIVVRGQRRFEVLLLDREKAYLRGAPQFFDDEEAGVPAEQAKEDRRRQALELYTRLAELLEPEDPASEQEPPDPGDAQLSFQLMGRLPADLAFKQTLLELRSEPERIARVIPYLEKMTTRLKRLIKVRSQVGGNGSGR
jgi:Lon protease-like protein